MSTATTTAQKVPTRPNFRTNKDQLVDFFGHGQHVVKYVGKCPVSGIRMYDMPGCPYPDHDYTTIEAAEYDMCGPDFVYSWLASNDAKQAAQALEMAKKTWLPTPASIGPVKSIIVRAVTWFDKANGNPYARATVYANGERVLEIPCQYDTPENIQHTAAAALEKAGFIQRLHRDNGTTESPQDWAKRTDANFQVSHYAASYDEYAQRGRYAI